MADASFRRAAEFGEGWTSGGLPPDAVASARERAEAAWREAGREGKPRILALAYFSLGDTEEVSRRNLLHYYEVAGSEMAEMVASSAPRSAEAIQGAVKAYEEAGADELILDPSVPDPDQVDLLAEVVFRS
jgi:alkanesulfonate monooxygenase SsuD/methylene tetrahydromethanopterin reductase-like flavin-dependent oxidoreductase (luciferase family)